MMNYYRTAALALLARFQGHPSDKFHLRAPRKAEETHRGKVYKESKKVHADIFHELNLKEYKGFVQQALHNFRGDIESCDNAGERDVLLQYCVRLMRKEMSAEADRLYTCYGYAIPDETRFKTELHGLAEKAVFQLRCSSAHC